MKISKYSHSCLLVSENDKTVLIDPGNYTVEDNSLDISSIANLNAILITHEHQDHMDVGLIKQILGKFPQAKVVTNESAAKILKEQGIEVVENANGVTATPISHEAIFFGPVPQNWQFDVFGKLSHPGDSFQFESIKDVLALPIQAPWGSLTQAVEKAVAIKPKIIIPIHDWHLNDKARTTFYGWLEEYFKGLGIDFRPLETGSSIEV